mgnify:CR=1 FL=1
MERKKRNHNEGSIRERADGRFEIRVTAGYDFEIGKPKRISYYAKTKAEAIQKLHEEEYKIHFQKHVDPTSTTFLDWLRLWLETYMKNKVKQSTYVSYRGYIENHLAPAFPTLKLKDLTTKLLQDFYNYKQNTQGLSPKTILNLHRCLHKAMNQAVLEHYIDFNPCDAVSLPRNEKPQVEILTREEQQKLIYTSYKYRYGIFIRLTLATGIRLGELLGLRWEDVDFNKRMLSIRRTINRLPKVDYNGVGNSTEIVIQEPKTKNSIRSIPLIPNIASELQQWKNVQQNDAMTSGAAYQDSGFLVTNPFGGYLEPRTFKDAYDESLRSWTLHLPRTQTHFCNPCHGTRHGRKNHFNSAWTFFGFVYAGYLHARSGQSETRGNESHGGVLHSARYATSTVLCNRSNANGKWLSAKSCGL